jgi:hypothetical protein
MSSEDPEAGNDQEEVTEHEQRERELMLPNVKDGLEGAFGFHDQLRPSENR